MSTVFIQAPTPTPAPPGVLPKITPDLNAPGISGFLQLANQIAGYALIFAAVAFLLSLLIMGIGGALGFRGARQFGGIGIITSLAIAGAIGLVTVLINAVYKIFS